MFDPNILMDQVHAGWKSLLVSKHHLFPKLIRRLLTKALLCICSEMIAGIYSCARRSPQTLFRRAIFSQVARLATPTRRQQRQYLCEVEAEDPHDYLRGLYFPVALRSTFKEGRYLVLHKLGWGGYATVWLAKDTLCVHYDPITHIH